MIKGYSSRESMVTYRESLMKSIMDMGKKPYYNSDGVLLSWEEV